MKSIKQIMEELGWEDNANPEVGKAFIKSLIRAAEENQRPIPLKPTEPRSKTSGQKAVETKCTEPVQLDLFKTSGGN